MNTTSVKRPKKLQAWDIVVLDEPFGDYKKRMPGVITRITKKGQGQYFVSFWNKKFSDLDEEVPVELLKKAPPRMVKAYIASFIEDNILIAILITANSKNRVVLMQLLAEQGITPEALAEMTQIQLARKVQDNPQVIDEFIAGYSDQQNNG